MRGLITRPQANAPTSRVTRVCRALAARVDLRQAGTCEDVGETFAAGVVVATPQPPAARDHAGIAGTEQRRAFIRGGELGEPGNDGGAGFVDCHAGGRGVGRAAGDAAIGQIGRAGFEFQLRHVEAERVGGDLRQRGPCALAHVMGADLHGAGTVAADHRARLGLEHQRGERRRADAPADQQAGIVTRRSRLQRPLRPAEALGAARVAFAQAF